MRNTLVSQLKKWSGLIKMVELIWMVVSELQSEKCYIGDKRVIKNSFFLLLKMLKYI